MRATSATTNINNRKQIRTRLIAQLLAAEEIGIAPMVSVDGRG